MTERCFQRVLPIGTMQGASVEAYAAAASAAGFDAISLRPAIVEEWLASAPGRGIAGLRTVLDDAGLSVAELDSVSGWHAPPRCATGVELSDALRRTMAWAAELDARRVTALILPGEHYEPGPAAEGLAAVGEMGADLGVAVQVEPFAWSALNSLAAAAALVGAAGPAERIGLMIDTWHLAQAGGGFQAVADVELERVHGVQVADGHLVASPADFASENRAGRRWPGEGTLHPEAVLIGLARRGWSGPVSIEVFGAAGPDPRGRADRARRALDLVLGRAAGTQPEG